MRAADTISRLRISTIWTAVRPMPASSSRSVNSWQNSAADSKSPSTTSSASPEFLESAAPLEAEDTPGPLRAPKPSRPPQSQASVTDRQGKIPSAATPHPTAAHRLLTKDADSGHPAAPLAVHHLEANPDPAR
jgi:hypothetical protein